jgi:RNA polymerase sigma-70 factor, ECF subfamily
MIDERVSDHSISDEALMLEFRHGSREAFDQLFARYRTRLFGFFRRRLPTDTRAEDLAQDTFVALIHGIERYQPRASVRSFLFGIAFNLLAAERRKHFREAPATGAAPEPATISDSTQILWLRQALAKLELSEREILMLREYEQLSYAEIAELLELPVNTVRSRLFRARMALKEQLEAKAPDTTAAIAKPATPKSIAEFRAAEEEGLL